MRMAVRQNRAACQTAPPMPGRRNLRSRRFPIIEQQGRQWGNRAIAAIPIANPERGASFPTVFPLLRWRSMPRATNGSAAGSIASEVRMRIIPMRSLDVPRTGKASPAVPFRTRPRPWRHSRFNAS